MTQSKIRLKYSGFVMFASRLLGAVSGVAFILMITRSVSLGEFGVWGNILDFIGYFTLFAGVLPFWTARFIARGYAGSAKTGIFANLFISIASASIYLGLVPTILLALQISNIYSILYTVVAIQIFELHIVSALEAVLLAKRPQTIGYGLLVHEGCKILLGFILIMQFRLGLLGAIYSVIISYFIQFVFYIILTAKELRESVNWVYLKEWLKGSPVSIYNIVGNQIATFSLIFLFVYGGGQARAYYQAGLTVASIIGYSSQLAFALYPRLLSGVSLEDVSTSIKLVMTFAIPMTLGIMVLSDSYLIILEAIYAEVRPVLLILAVTTLFGSIAGIFSNVVKGTEKVDVKAKIAFGELVKSRLFLLFSLPYIFSAVWLPMVFVILIFIAQAPLDAAIYFALIGLLWTSGHLIATYIIARKCLAFSFPWKNVFKYVLASAVMATVLLVIPHPTRLSTTVAYTLLGAAIYVAILTLIDKETKTLVRSILQEAMHVTKVRKKSRKA